MLPNSEIWGQQTDWIPAKYFYFVGSGDAETRTIKPKTANFADNDGTLSKGASQSKTPVDESIDMTICPCGQDPVYSCFGSIALFKNKQDADDNKTPDTVITQTMSCNWFLFDGTGAFFSTTEGHLRDRTNSQQRWSPDCDLQNNWNGYITPFTYWQLKSMLIHITVKCITGYVGNGTPSYTWRYLNDWKENHSSEKICDIKLSFRGVSSTAGTNITYTSNSTMSTGNIGGVALLDSLEGVIDYAAFAFARETSFTLLGVLIGNYYNTSSTFYMPCYNMFENMEYKALSSSSPEYGWCVWAEIPYSANNYEKIMQMAACFGIPFTDKDKVTFPINYVDDDLYLPVIDDNGITHGEYTHGTDNTLNDLYEADSIRDKNYVPEKPVDDNTYSNITGFNSISGGASMTRRYVLDKANVDTLSDDLWTISSELATVQGDIDYNNFEAKVIDNFLVTSPIDCIVSLKRFPFDVPHTFSNTKELVKLGKNTATAQGYATYNVFNTVQFKGINIYKRFGGCFLDYEPYTQYELYVPFCGTTPLQAADIIGHTLNVRLQIDLLTGTCTAYIMADSLVIETLTGSVACDLQVTGTDTTYMNGAIVNSITNARNAKTQQEVAKTSVFSPSGLLGSVMNPWKTAGNITQANTNRYQADYDLQHIQTPLHSMGTASALTGWYQEFNARLMIYYPMGDAIISSVPPSLANLTNYGHTTGFATVENKTLSNYTGLTVCSDADLSGISQATATEKEMIYNALTGGVYI